MSKALEIDRELIKTLWLQGLTPAQINSKTGLNPMTLRQWVNRYNWNSHRDAIKDQLVKLKEKPLVKGALTLRDEAASILSTDIKLISKSQVKSARGAYDRQKKLEPWVRNAKVICGWNEGQPNTLVNINVLSTNSDTQPKELTGETTLKVVCHESASAVEGLEKECLIPKNPQV